MCLSAANNTCGTRREVDQVAAVGFYFAAAAHKTEGSSCAAIYTAGHCASYAAGGVAPAAADGGVFVAGGVVFAAADGAAAAAGGVVNAAADGAV